jgi:DNA gyrase/topoisomerase IV subunit A
MMVTLRSARRAAKLVEERAEYLLEEQERSKVIRGLQEGLDHEREERKCLHEKLRQERQELNQERQERLQAQQRAERAEQEALREAMQQLRARVDGYLKELEEEGTWPGGIHRVK